MQHTAKLSYPDAYSQLSRPASVWWLRLSQALGYRDIGPGLEGRHIRYAGISIETCQHQPVRISQLVGCLRDLLRFPNVPIRREFRSHIQDCCYAWDRGGDDAFCDKWDEGEYLLPGQKNGQTTAEFLGR